MAKKILVADDSDTIKKIMDITFKNEDYDVIYASNGEDAINKAAKEQPDVFLIDIGLPEMDGYSLIKKIKENIGNTSAIFIALCSAHAEFNHQSAKEVGVNGSIKKPFSSDELLTLVNKFSGKEKEEVDADEELVEAEIVEEEDFKDELESEKEEDSDIPASERLAASQEDFGIEETIVEGEEVDEESLEEEEKEESLESPLPSSEKEEVDLWESPSEVESALESEVEDSGILEEGVAIKEDATFQEESISDQIQEDIVPEGGGAGLSEELSSEQIPMEEASPATSEVSFEDMIDKSLSTDETQKDEDENSYFDEKEETYEEVGKTEGESGVLEEESYSEDKESLSINEDISEQSLLEESPSFSDDKVSEEAAFKDEPILDQVESDQGNELTEEPRVASFSTEDVAKAIPEEKIEKIVEDITKPILENAIGKVLPSLIEKIINEKIETLLKEKVK